MIDVVETRTPLDLDVVDHAADALLEGGLLVLRTDTVYGLVVAAELQRAVDRVFQVKDRPRELALPVLVGSLDQARSLARFNPQAERLASRFWPGPLTLVLDRRPGFTADLGGNPSTVGLRLADSELVVALCAAVGPLAATSANASGGPEPYDIAIAREALGDEVDLYLDSGTCKESMPSTVIDVRGRPKVIREGAIDAATLRIEES